MKFEHWARSFGLVIVLFLLVACGGDTEEGFTDDLEAEDTQVAAEAEADVSEVAESGEDVETVTLVHAVSQWQIGFYEELYDQFSEEHPNIRVEFISSDEAYQNYQPQNPEDYNEAEILIEIAKSADVMPYQNNGYPVPDGLLLDMTPFIESDPTVSFDDFHAGALDQYQWDGGLWAYPTSTGYMLFFYDKDMFDAAGVDYPEPGWTWEDMLSKAQSLTIRDGSEVTQWGLTLTNMDSLALLEARGAQLLDANGQPRFESDDVASAVDWYTGVFLDFEVSPIQTWDEETGQILINGVASERGVYDMIEEGQIAMWPEFDQSWSYRSQSGDRNIGVVPFPVSSDKQNTTPIAPWSSEAWAISAGTTKPEAAWTWINYLASGVDAELNSPFGETRFASRQSVVEASGFFDEVDEEYGAAMQYASANAFAPTSNPNLWSSLGSKMGEVLEGDIDVPDALREAQDSMVKALEEAAGEDPDKPVETFTVAEPEAIDENATVIEFIVAGGDTSLYRPIAEAFEEANPGIVVKLREPNYYSDDFSLTSLVGDADCFQWWGSVTDPSSLANLVPVEPLMDADPELGSDDFFPGALSQFRVQGQLYGIPGGIQLSLLNYNKALFDEAGVPYPEAGWTYDQFLETVVALTDGDDPDTKTYGFVPSEYEFIDLITIMERQGAQPFDFTADPPTVQFDSPEMISALRFYSNLTVEYDAKPVFNLGQNFNPDSFGNRQAMINSGRAGIWTTDQFAGFGGGFEEEEGLDPELIGFVPYPVGQNGETSFTQVTGYYINASSAHRQPCWELIKFLTNDGSLHQYDFPSRISTSESAEFEAFYGAEKAAVARQELANSASSPSIFNSFNEQNNWIGFTFQWFEQAYTNVVQEGLSVEDALTDAQSKADVFRSCVLSLTDFDPAEDFEDIESCAKEADPNYSGF